MTDREIDPSLLPDTPLPSQDNTTTNVGEDVRRESPLLPRRRAVWASCQTIRGKAVAVRARRSRIFIGEILLVPAAVPAGEAEPTGAANASGRALPDGQNADDRRTISPQPARAVNVDPIDALVEFVFPARTFTDWLLVDPLRRGELFKQAITKDPAGVSAASAHARAVGYTASRFTEALKTLVSSEVLLKPPALEEPIVGAFEQKSEQAPRQRDGEIALPNNWQGQDDVNRNETLQMAERGVNRRVAVWAELANLAGSWNRQA